MNVSTSSAAATASTSDVSSTQTQSKSSSSSRTDKSFEDEIKSASNSDSKEVSEDTKAQASSEDKKASQESSKDSNKDANKLNNELKDPDSIVPQDIYTGGINFTDYKYGNGNQLILSQNIQDLINTKDMMSAVSSASLASDYDTVNMSDSDAMFFVNLTQNTDMSMQSIAGQIENALQDNVENVQQNVKVSATLMNKLAESMKNNQSFRIDFDKDVSVIIKVNKDGSLMANFIPGDKAVEQYLKNNIASLRQRFDEQNLQYSELSYSNSRQQQQQQNRKKEKNNE